MEPKTAWQDAAAEALKILVQSGCDYADVFIEDARASRIRIEDAKPDQIVTGGEFGAGLRLIKERTTYFASTNDVTVAGLTAAARDLARSHPVQSRTLANLTRLEKRWQKINSPSAIPLEERIGLAMKAEGAARKAGPHIKQVTAFLSSHEQAVGIARSDGFWCEDERVQVVLWVNAVAGQDQQIQTGYESTGGSVGWEYFDTHDPEAVGRLAGRRAELMLSARPAPSGRMTVVLAAEAGGTMIHEAIGHSLEADLILKGLSPFANKIGQAVASPLISVVDDATVPGWRGTFGYDDEGTPAQRTLLVDQGILKGFMNDWLSSREMKMAATGNGRRQGYNFRPIPRMTNTMILPGLEDAAAILRSVDNGLYVVRMGGGQVNTVNGDFIFEVNEGYLIRGGALAEPVRGASLVGNGQEVLKSIDRVANDHGRSIGTCGKDGQGAPVADAQPTIRIPEITVGGSE
jgi:TldD protein